MTHNVLSGKTAFIAGGSSGINLGVAHGFAEAGARVALLSRSQDKIDAAVAELRAAGHEASGFAADVRDYDAIEAALESTHEADGPIDIVLSGTAGNFLAPAGELSANGFKTVVHIDLLGTLNVFRASYEYLKRPGAALIAVTAAHAVTPIANQIHACAAKAGVNMVTKCLALEWGPEGIRVNGIAPGPIADTEGMRRLAPTPEWEAAYKATIPMRDYGTKRDIANLAVFLASDAAAYISGTIVDCDGASGLTAGSVGRIRQGLSR